ncbi:MAG: ATP-binding cassette domain-containing protein [Nigerium sp.]|nr:ATP-binding cassette domain-containing protein [Nigerium sp.]
MIRIDSLGKSYPGFELKGVTFEVRPGEVVGFLGPNGAGKSTTLRLLLGLERPATGSATVDGLYYRQLDRPLTRIGSLLDTGWINPRQSCVDYLTWVAVANGISRHRVKEVLDLVGISSVGRRQVGKLSLGMKQRLGIACSLLGDPQFLVFDEPLNGLDPEGIIWVRNLLRSLADEGKGVLLSSHQLNEVGQTADRVVLIGGGIIRTTGRVDELTEGGRSLEQVFLEKLTDSVDYRGRTR